LEGSGGIMEALFGFYKAGKYRLMLCSRDPKGVPYEYKTRDKNLMDLTNATKLYREDHSFLLR
jgi:hypothetical protein